MGTHQRLARPYKGSSDHGSYGTEDIADQLYRALGKAHKAFLERLGGKVGDRDPQRSQRLSSRDFVWARKGSELWVPVCKWLLMVLSWAYQNSEFWGPYQRIYFGPKGLVNGPLLCALVRFWWCLPYAPCLVYDI